MDHPVLGEVLEQAERLAIDEQLMLIEYLARRIQQRRQHPVLEWRDLRGMASSPLFGEDAQAWVSRTRREGDEAREAVWRKNE
jgi:hypothetical protein